MRLRAARGFTLIEMMVVVAIISIPVALAVNLRTTTYGANTATVADQVVSRLEFARMRAISTRHTQRVQLTNNIVTILNGDQSGMVTPASFTELQQMILPNAVVIWASDTAVNAAPTNPGMGETSPLAVFVDFRPDGSVGPGSQGTLYLTDTHRAHDFRVIVYKVTGSVFSRPVW